MSDTQSGSSTTETSIGNQSTFFAEVTRFYIRGRIQHFLHTGATLRTFVRNDDNIATDDSAPKDTFTGCFLRIKDFGRSGEFPDTFVHTCCFYYATILCYVSFQYRQSAIFAISVFEITDTPISAVCIQLFIVHTLRTEYKIKFICSCTRIFPDCFFAHIRAGD